MQLRLLLQILLKMQLLLGVWFFTMFFRKSNLLQSIEQFLLILLVLPDYTGDPEPKIWVAIFILAFSLSTYFLRLQFEIPSA